MQGHDFRQLFGLAGMSEEQALRVYIDRQFSRVVAHGVDHDVARRVVGRVESLDRWAAEWAREAQHWESIAREARRRGHKATARDAFFQASNCYRVGQHILHDDAQKLAYYPKVVSLYQAGGKLMDPPMQTVAVRSPFGSLPAYLSLPASRGRFPGVLLAGGADGWREEYLPATLAFLERGFAVLNCDAPGQGAARLMKRKFMPVDVERFFSSAVDLLGAHPNVDRNRIFMVGHSVGGYLTLRTASAEPRIAACAALGAPYDLLSVSDGSPPARQINFALLCGTGDPAKARDTLEQFTLEGRLAHIRCPVLVIHGMKDSVVPYRHVERIRAEIESPLELWTWEDGIHTCDNYVAEVYPRIADRFLEPGLARTRSRPGGALKRPSGPAFASGAAAPRRRRA